MEICQAILPAVHSSHHKPFIIYILIFNPFEYNNLTRYPHIGIICFQYLTGYFSSGDILHREGHPAFRAWSRPGPITGLYRPGGTECEQDRDRLESLLLVESREKSRGSPNPERSHQCQGRDH
jgi:hypothetical protein